MSEPLTHRAATLVAAVKLRQRKFRDREHAFLAEGQQAVAEALANPDRVERLFVTAGSRLPTVTDVPVSLVTDAAMKALSDTVTPQGVVARCRIVDAELSDIALPTLVSVAVAVSDPGNAGTLVRLADAVGASAMVFADDSVDPYNPKAVRASTGSVFHLPIVRGVELAEVLRWAATNRLRTYATTGHADTDLFTLAGSGDLAEPAMWLFGNEAHGLPETVLAAADIRVRIPIYGKAESLNLASAAAICLYASGSALRRLPSLSKEGA